MSRRILTMDWSATPLGPMRTWSPTLHATVRLMLANRFPHILWWGPEFIQFYNDAYIPIPGTKHPKALGQRGSECWPEIWHVIGPLVETPFSGGPATWMDDIFLEVHRHGFVEETHFTIAYSPVPDDTAPNGIGGVLGTIHETTQQVIQERRLAVLGDLGTHVAGGKTAEEACVIVARVLSKHSKDIPFALIYLASADGKTAELVASTGVAPGAASAPITVSLEHDDKAGWPVASAFRAERSERVADLASRFSADAPPGPWTDPPSHALVLPILSSGQHRVAGVLVFGISARIALDDAYAGFTELVAAQVAVAIANARAYEEERRRAEALAEIDRAKTAFFSNVSHEFRTPLTLLLGPLEEALAAGTDGTERDTREQLTVAHRNGLRLLKLVNTLLDFSRIEAGRLQATYAPVDLAAFTTDLAGTFRSAIERAGLTLRVECPPLEEPAYVDADMWEKIVLNLISNAFKHTFAGEVGVALRRSGDRFVLEVRDTGVGIPAEQLPHLFERFYRVPNTRSRTHEGTGIGLALVQELARLHGGTVEIASEEGVGSTFTVTIPAGTGHLPPDRVTTNVRARVRSGGATSYVEEALRWLPDAPPPVVPETELPLGSSNASDPTLVETRRARVLVADDNADMRGYAARLLGTRWEVEVVSDGAAALARIRERAPDLLLTDVMMPGMDGFGLLHELRADPATREMPVILLSARAGEEARVEGLEAGAHDYLLKPFSARELVARVGATLELARVRKESAAALRASEERLRQATKMEAVGRLAGGLAHDFNNQLQALMGYARYAAMDPGISPRSRQDLDEVQRAANRLADLTRQLLAFSRQQILRPELLDIDEAVSEGLQLLQPLIGSQIVFRVHRGPEAKWVHADRTQIQQVLMNLCLNGRDAMPEGGHLEIHTGIRDLDQVMPAPNSGTSIPAGRYVELVVMDTGGGIEPDHLTQVFEPFFTTKEVGKGTGLGLATVHGIVAQSRGYVYVESVPERGSRFTVLFPAAEPPAGAGDSLRPDDKRAFRRPTLLMVEDEETVRAVLSRFLTDVGYEVLQARHGREALEVLEEHGDRIALVVSDVVMPVMGGKELAARLAASRPDLPLIWMSGYPTDTTLGALTGAASHPFLAKPIDPQVLIETVRGVLA